MWWLRYKKITIIAPLLLTILACQNDERYIITDKAPFYQVNIAYREKNNDYIIGAVRLFSKKNSMDFLLARKSLPQGDFNDSANGPRLNLQVIHISILSNNLSISAISKSNPTANDWALTHKFFDEIAAVADK